MSAPVHIPPLHVEVRPPRAASARAPLLLLLHGLGADEHDLLPLAEMLDGRCRVAAVRATFPYDFGGYAWYDIGQAGRPDPLRFPESHRRLLRTVELLCSRPDVDPTRVVLFGFSMGAVMSLALALTHPELFLGVAANSGYFPEGTELVFRPEAARRLDVFLAHGTADPLIPVGFAHAARLSLERMGVPVTYREYPMAHEIGPPSLADAAAWLTALLDRSFASAP